MDKILEQIELKSEKLNKLIQNTNNLSSLILWLRYELAFTSNAIEGNTLTRKETVRIIEDKITSSSKPFVYYQEAINHAKAFNKMLEFFNANKNFTEDELLNIHRIILSGIDDDNAGFYRNCRVSISGSRVVLPNPIKVPALMTEFFEWLDSIDKTSPLAAIEAHYRLVKIHPFIDGNGRCARLLMNYFLAKAGYVPIIIRMIDRKRYIDNIEKYQLQNDSQPYFKFMLSCLDKTLSACIDIIDVEKDDVDKEDLLTISQFAKLVSLPISTIRYWVKMEKLKPIQYTISGYMLFSKLQKADVQMILKSRKKKYGTKD